MRQSELMADTTDFQKLLDEILEEIIRIDASGKNYELPLITRNVIHLIRHLKVQLDIRESHMMRLEERVAQLEKMIRIRLKNDQKSKKDQLTS